MRYGAAAVTVFLAGVLAIAQDMQPSAMSANPSASTTASSGMTTEGVSVAEHLRRLEDEWARAMVTKNAASIRKFEAPEYMVVMPDGKVRDREADLASLKKTSLTDFTNSDMQVRVYGDTAIVSGVGHLKGSEDGKDVSGDYRFTDVFVKRDGKWEAVHSTATKVAP